MKRRDVVPCAEQLSTVAEQLLSRPGSPSALTHRRDRSELEMKSHYHIHCYWACYHSLFINPLGLHPGWDESQFKFGRDIHDHSPLSPVANTVASLDSDCVSFSWLSSWFFDLKKRKMALFRLFLSLAFLFLFLFGATGNMVGRAPSIKH